MRKSEKEARGFSLRADWPPGQTDEELCSEIASLSHSRWERIQARRAFMQEQLGIRLDESILPLSNIPGWLPPYVLDCGKVLALT